MVVITSNQRDVILDAVRTMYTEVATRPEQSFHFPTGRFACAFVGYDAAVLDRLPPAALESFAGVGNPFRAQVIKSGDTVLDIGSGSGTDVLIAAQLAGPRGRVYALDMTAAMRDKLTRTLRDQEILNVEVLAGDAESIPLPDASVDVVTSNGVINLVPDKQTVAEEIARVLKPGGQLQLADIVLAQTASEACRSQPQLWAECIVGAVTEADYVRQLEQAGLANVRVLHRQDYFSGSEHQSTRSVAQQLGAIAFVLTASKRSVS